MGGNASEGSGTLPKRATSGRMKPASITGRYSDGSGRYAQNCGVNGAECTRGLGTAHRPGHKSAAPGEVRDGKRDLEVVRGWRCVEYQTEAQSERWEFSGAVGSRETASALLERTAGATDARRLRRSSGSAARQRRRKNGRKEHKYAQRWGKRERSTAVSQTAARVTDQTEQEPRIAMYVQRVMLASRRVQTHAHGAGHLPT